ncbi:MULTISPECIES: SsgA family sporulation/cell division regulator [unclassified Frankia]|uniref:SsgA family sporulation/cell division regulator n=1 Tax=unclassified Frankia TaxID=2632575 RepID=UPI00200D45F7|nr:MULTISPECIES: SsgA family sporulation/cell division regulator [unclassified Frankia]MCK9896218.1 SsgA family sporulation/cell division regulator [Frankia sp. AgB32]MCL9797357.1 SsgA family sporulation/cell division regulator [Frankia sp. AgKG'84/4]
MLRHSSTPAHVVVRDLSADFVTDDGVRTAVAGTLRYDPADPFAVELILRPGRESITWIFARSLLAEGTQTRAGTGDVRIRPTRTRGRAVVTVSLSSPSGRADLELCRSVVTRFLAEIEAQVPTGREGEGVNWEAELRTLLRTRNP